MKRLSLRPFLVQKRLLAAASAAFFSTQFLIGQSCVDSLGRVWSAAENGRLVRTDASGSRSILLFEKDSAQRSKTKISALAAGAGGSVWAATMGGGLAFFDEKSQKTELFRAKKGQTTRLPSDSVSAVGLDFEGETWAAGPAFLSQKLGPLDVFRTFRFDSLASKKSVPTAIFFDRRSPQRVWLATSEGHFLFDRVTERFRFFSKTEGTATRLFQPVFQPTIQAAEPSKPTFSSEKIEPFWLQNWFMALAGGIGAGLFWLFWRWQLRRIRKEEALKFKIQELENQLLRSSLNPHFVFNSLNSIKNYILSNERLAAADYLGGFAQLMRNLLDHSRSDRISLRDELDTLRLWVSMEQLRARKKFDFSLEVDPKIVQDDLLVQPLLLQPFVENAIKHGFRGKETKGRLRVEVLRDGSDLVYRIEDDGEGRVRREAIRAATQAEEARSHEIQITRDRLLMSQKDATIDWTDVVDEKGRSIGTRVEIRMKMAAGEAFLAFS